MRIAKLFMTVAALTMVTATASANAKCNHRNSNSMFANTNPVKTKATTDKGNSGSGATRPGVQ